MRATVLFRLLLSTLGSLLLLYVLYRNQGTLILLSLSFVVAYLLDPSIDQGERLGLSRTLAITILTTVLVLGLGVLLLVVLPQLQGQARQIATRAPGWGQSLYNYLAPLREQLAEPLEQYFGIRLDSAKVYAARIQEWVLSHLPGITQGVLSLFQSMFTGLANFIVGALNILLMPVLVFYLLRDFDILQAHFYAALPPHWRPVVADWLGRLIRQSGALCAASVRLRRCWRPCTPWGWR